MSEMASKTRDDESLVVAPYLDSLTVINQEGLREARAERKKTCDARRVRNYLCRKFPYADPDVDKIPIKEFPGIAKRAKNYFLVRTAGASLCVLASVGGITYSIVMIISAIHQESVGLLFEGLGIATLALVSLSFAGLVTNNFFRLFTGKQKRRGY